MMGSSEIGDLNQDYGLNSMPPADNPIDSIIRENKIRQSIKKTAKAPDMYVPQLFRKESVVQATS
jgi:hypothetical protein